MMQSTEFRLPDLATLHQELAAVFEMEGNVLGKFTIVDRQTNPYQSTFPCEIISISFDGRAPVNLFCKHEAGITDANGSHRRSLGHEVEVYRRILMPLGVTVPRYYAGYADIAGNQSWILLQHIDSALRVNKARAKPPAVVMAAGWIGDFHRRTPALASTQSPDSLLDAYDEPYLLRRVPRLLEQEAPTLDRFPWIKALLARYEADISLLCSDPVVIHAEYYPDNVLYSNGCIYPVDWQSAASGAGEIDLAILTEGEWNSQTVLECQNAYSRARWPEGAPADFTARLAMAKVYWLTHVLSHRAGWITDESYIQELRSAALAIGVI